MGDVAAPGADSSVPAEPATTAPAAGTSPDGYQVNITSAFGPPGVVRRGARQRVHVGHVRPRRGYGLFGSAGQGKAARETTGGASVKMGLGPFSGELDVMDNGITANGNMSIPLNPGVNRVESTAYTLNRDMTITETRTEGVSFGVQQGLASTQPVTIAIPNSAFDTVANWLGFGPQSAGRQGGW